MWERGWEGKHGQVWPIGRDGLGVRIMSPSAFENKLGKAVSTERDLSFYCTLAGGINRKGQQHLLLP